MNKQIFILGFVFLVLISSVNAGFNASENASDYWEFDNFDSVVAGGLPNASYWDVRQNVVISTFSPADSGNQTVTAFANQDVRVTKTDVLRGIKTMSVMVYDENTTGNDRAWISMIRTGGMVAYMGIYIPTSTDTYVWRNITAIGGADWTDTGIPRKKNQWVEFAISVNNETDVVSYYVDGVFVGNFTALTPFPFINTRGINTGSASLGYEYDSYRVWNGTYSDRPGTTFIDEEAVNIESPDDEAQIRSDYLNISFNFSNFEPNNCSLYSNQSGSFEIEDSIATGSYNETTFFNVTIENVNITDAINMYRFEENGGSVAIDIAQGNNGTINGNSWSSSKGNNGTGNYSLEFSVDYVQIPYQDYYSFGTSQDFSISAWIRSDHASDGQYHMIVDTRDAGSDGIFLAITTSDTIQCALNDVSMESSTTIDDNSWHHIVCVFDRNSSINSDIWIDGIGESVGITTSSKDISTSSDLFIGIRSFSAGVYWEGDLDEIYILNKTLDENDISSLYNDGLIYNTTELQNSTAEVNETLIENVTYNLSIINPLPDKAELEYYITCTDDILNISSENRTLEYDYDFTAPIITLIFPPTPNLTWSQNLTINFTTDEYANCFSSNDNFTEAFSNGTTHLFNESVFLPNGYYETNLTCSDVHYFAPLNNVTENITFWKDIISPIIEIFSPLNNSIYTNEDFLLVKWTATDDIMLYNYKVNVTRGFDDEDFYNDEQNISGTEFNFINTPDISNFTAENYSMTVRVCDAHTNNEIKKADYIEKNNKSLRFIFKNTEINIESLEDIKSMDYSKQKDRYKFEFDFKDKNKKSKKIKLNSNKNINYLENSKYKGHFVINDEYWIDFEQDGNVLVTKDNEDYIIEVFNEKDKIKFNSIGELNCNSETIFIEIIDFDDSLIDYDELNYELEQERFSLILSISILGVLLILFTVGMLFFPPIATLSGIGMIIYSFTPYFTDWYLRIILIFAGICMMAISVFKYLWGEK